MRKLIGSCLLGCAASGALFAAGGKALAHHSFSMFDCAAPTDLEGTVQEFRYSNPHSFIILRVKGTNGHAAIWTLEGGSPSTLERDGWSRATLKPGDQIRLTVSPLRSGEAVESELGPLPRRQDRRPVMVIGDERPRRRKVGAIAT